MPIVINSSLAISHGGATAAATVQLERELATSGKKTVLTQVLSTSLADVNTGAITWSDGTWLVINNLSSTVGEIVTVAKSAVEFAEIYPGESFGPVHIKADGTAIRAKSAAGTPTIQVVMAGPLA